MVSDILYKKKLGIPYLTLILAISCILVSVPTYFYPELYDVFGWEKPIYYPWQVVTHHLQHGSYMGLLPLPLHLICNLTVIMTFGVISEKVLGVKRFFIGIFTSLFTAQLIVEIYPQSGPVDVINNANNRIVIKFSKPMKNELNQSSFNFLF